MTPDPIDFTRYAHQGRARGQAKPKAERKPRTPTDPNTLAKLAAQRDVPIGASLIYRGPNHRILGKAVKVVGHQSRGNVYVEHDGTQLTVSPFTLWSADEVAAHRAAARKYIAALEFKSLLTALHRAIDSTIGGDIGAAAGELGARYPYRGVGDLIGTAAAIYSEIIRRHRVKEAE